VSRSGETLECFGYVPDELVESVRAQLGEKTRRGDLSAEDAETILEAYRSRLAQYTYLD
jgi:arginine decarboxylase-like protein